MVVSMVSFLLILADPMKINDQERIKIIMSIQALAVLSTVSIIYLSVIIYLPGIILFFHSMPVTVIEIVHGLVSAKRELESGIGETPVMCQTSQSRHIDNDIELCK